MINNLLFVLATASSLNVSNATSAKNIIIRDALYYVELASADGISTSLEEQFYIQDLAGNIYAVQIGNISFITFK